MAVSKLSITRKMLFRYFYFRFAFSFPYKAISSHFLIDPVVSINLEKVKLLSLWGWKQIVQRDFWMGCDENQTSSKLWQVLSKIPPQCETQEMKVEMSNQEKVAYLNQCSEERLHENRPYLQSKQDHSLVLHPEIVFETKGQDADGNRMWGKNVGKWIVNQVG